MKYHIAPKRRGPQSHARAWTMEEGSRVPGSALGCQSRRMPGHMRIDARIPSGETEASPLFYSPKGKPKYDSLDADPGGAVSFLGVLTELSAGVRVTKSHCTESLHPARRVAAP